MMFIRSAVSGQRRVTVTHTEPTRRYSEIEMRKCSVTTYLARRRLSHNEVSISSKRNQSPFQNTLSNTFEEKEEEAEEVRSRDKSPDQILYASILMSKTRITLNIGGTLFQTYESTLNVFPNTLLGNKLSRDKFYNGVTEEYVLNRCSYSFNAILFYYQSKGILAKPSDIDRDIFLAELEFYKITEYIDARHRQEVEFVEKDKLSKVLPTGKIQKLLWQSLEFHNKSPITQCFFYFYLFTSLFALFVFCAETIPEISSNELWPPLETAVNVAFTFEYGLRLYASPNTKRFMLSPCGIIDLITVMPYYANLVIRVIGAHDSFLPLSFLTLIRVGRVFKLTRFHEGLRILMMTIYESLVHLVSLLLSITITSLLFASLMFYLEYKVIKENNQFISIPDTFWYTVITATGVGYGDMYPETTLGKLVGGILAVIGVLLFCLPTPMLVNKFVECYYLRQTFSSGVKMDEQRKNVVKRMRETFLHNT